VELDSYSHLPDFDQGLDQEIRRILSKAGVPGAVCAISVPGHEVIGSYGVIDASGDLPVGPDTAFDIGSCSKAFVATAIALLASSGRLGLDDPVKAYLPDFELDEERVTESITIRDLLCNRSGLRRQIPVTAYSNPDIPAQEILHRVRYMDRTHAFRQGYVYFNPAFMACAQVVENVTGLPYSAFLEKELFAAIGLRNTASGPRVADTLPDRASGHTFVHGQPVPLQGPVYNNMEGAAAVYSSASDAIRWMKFHLNGGRVGHTQLIKPDILAQTHKPHTRIPDAECKLIHRPPEAERCDYCMGWWLTKLDSQPLLQHAGEAVGWRAMVAMLPDQQIAAAIFLNAAVGTHQVIAYTVLETLWTGQSRDWESIARIERQDIDKQVREFSAQQFPCSKGSPPCAALEKLEGRYKHPACGQVEVMLRDENLEMRLLDGHLWHTRLHHLGNEVFECQFIDPAARDFMPSPWRLEFLVKDGKVTGIEDINAAYTRL